MGTASSPQETKTAAYTIKNLKEIDDAALRFGLSPDLEARYARKALECEKLGFTYFKLASGFRVPFGHHHREQEEVYLVVEGSARIRLGDEVRELGEWDAVRLAPETVRALEAGPGGAVLIAVGAPSTGESDAELIQGWWSD